VSLEGLHRVLEQCGARRLARDVPVFALRKTLWPPFRRSDLLHERQASILDAVRSLPWSVFLHGVRASSAWPRTARDTWCVPTQERAADLLAGVLEPGRWTLYLAPHALDPSVLPDAFGGDLGELTDFVASHSVPVLLEAYRANEEWRIVVEPAAVRGRVAA
jgi:hypothetical protein